MNFLKLIQFVAATLMLCSSCKHEFENIETNGIEKNINTIEPYELTNCDEWYECEYKVHKNSSVIDSLILYRSYFDKDEEYEFIITEVQQGEKNVFVFKSSSLPFVIDGNLIYILFEVDEEETIFSFENQKLSSIKAIFQNFCGECAGSTSQYIENGIIKGEKMGDNKWYIEIDLPRKDFFPNSEDNQRIIVKNIFSVI